MSPRHTLVRLHGPEQEYPAVIPRTTGAGGASPADQPSAEVGQMIEMQTHQFRYDSLAFHTPGSGVIWITLTRKADGISFIAELTVEDAQRLADELPNQIRIAGNKDA